MTKPTLSPLVSVIIPAYNCSDTILETLNSIFSQTYKNLEIIVVNDGSTDSTEDVLNNFIDQIYLINQSNQGVSCARNAGINVATGKYLALIDSDDYWFKEKIETQVKYLENNPDKGAVYANWNRWYPDAQGTYPDPEAFAPTIVDYSIDESESGWVYQQLLLDCILNSSAILVRSQILKSLNGFDPKLSVGEDYDLWFRLSRVTQIDKLATPLLLYRIRPGSVTNRTPPNTCYELIILKKALSQWGYISPNGTKINKVLVDNRLSNICFSFAYLHFHKGDISIAISFLFKSIKYKPFQLNSWKYLPLSLLMVVLKKFKVN